MTPPFLDSIIEIPKNVLGSFHTTWDTHEFSIKSSLTDVINLVKL